VVFPGPMRCWPGKLGVGSVGCALAVLGLASGVAAQAPESEPVHITYGAVAACPGRDAFIAQVQARTSRARVAADGELGRTIAVSVQPTGRGFFGTLVVTTPAGETSTRDVSAESCDEVVEALALITALTIDPEANTRPLREVAAPPSAAPIQPETAQPAAPQPAPAPPPPQTPPAAPAAAPVTPAEQTAPGVAPLPAALPDEAGPEASETRLVAGAQGEVLVDSIAPHWVLAPRIFVEVGSTAAALLSPKGGLSVAGTSTDVETQVGDARLLWLAARAEGCPLNLTGDETVGLRPCVTFEGGILRGVGRSKPGGPVLEDPSSATMTWLAAGMLLRLQVALAQWIELRADAGLAATLLQPSFVFSRDDEDVVIHEVPAWAPHFGLGVGLPLLP
jgi:hypothetical protein